MKKKKVTALEVIRIYYIGEELLGEVFKISGSQKKKKVKALLKKILNKSKKLSKKELLDYHMDGYHLRFDNYLNSKWELKEINLKDCGVWPRMGGLPEEATTGTILDTVEFVKPYLEDKSKLTFKTARILYVEEMMKYVEDIIKEIPIIVMEEGVIRHNKLRNVSRMKKYKKCKYDIEDGNHRALALAMLGNKKIKALVGKRTCKSDLLY